VLNKNDVDGYTGYTKRVCFRKQLKPRALGTRLKAHKKYRLITLGNRRILVLLLGMLSVLLTLPLNGQENDVDDANRSHDGFCNILIGPIGGIAKVSTEEHPSYTTYGISVRYRMTKYAGFVLNHEKYLLTPSDEELKDSEYYPIVDQSVTSFGIQGVLPVLDMLSLNGELKIKLSNTDEDNSAIMLGSGFEVKIFPHFYVVGQQNMAYYNVKTPNFIDGPLFNSSSFYTYRSWHLGLSYAIFE